MVANETYKVGTPVRIIDDKREYSPYDAKCMRGRSGTVVMCCREGNHRSHYVAVYVILDEFKAYGPSVVVKGTPQSMCKCREEEQHIRHRTGWHVWRFPHEMFWELPPRHDGDRADTRKKLPGVDPEHWGKEYWRNRITEQMAR